MASLGLSGTFQRMNAVAIATTRKPTGATEEEPKCRQGKTKKKKKEKSGSIKRDRATRKPCSREAIPERETSILAQGGNSKPKGE